MLKVDRDGTVMSGEVGGSCSSGDDDGDVDGKGNDDAAMQLEDQPRQAVPMSKQPEQPLSTRNKHDHQPLVDADGFEVVQKPGRRRGMHRQ